MTIQGGSEKAAKISTCHNSASKSCTVFLARSVKAFNVIAPSTDCHSAQLISSFWHKLKTKLFDIVFRTLKHAPPIQLWHINVTVELDFIDLLNEKFTNKYKCYFENFFWNATTLQQRWRKTEGDSQSPTTTVRVGNTLARGQHVLTQNSIEQD